MKLPRLPCTVRLGKPDDLAFVVDSWTKHGFRKQPLSKATRHVRALLGREMSYLRVAHVPDDPDAILGWAALEDGETPCVHYVYVRSTGRLQGVARALLGRCADEPMDYSSAAPSDVEPPAAWNLNLKRAET